VRHVVTDFIGEYRDVAMPDGAKAKLAIYFPQTDDLEELRPIVELTLAAEGLPPTIVLAHTSKTGADSLAAFNRLNDPRSEHRIILLVNIGTEGWNCPSLFATALARKLTSSNNFVLQAAGRCLRQVPGNDAPARIYLSADNRSTLDRQLQETYGERIADLDRTARVTRRDRITLDPAKLPIPPLVLQRTRRVLRRAALATEDLVFTPPVTDGPTDMLGAAIEVGPQVATRRMLRAVGDAIVIERPVTTVDLYRAAVELAANARRPSMPILQALRAAYPLDTTEIAIAHLAGLGAQLDALLGDYEPVDVIEEVELRVVKPEGFDPEPQPDGSVSLVADISYPEDRAGLVFGPDRLARENAAGYGFHYASLQLRLPSRGGLLRARRGGAQHGGRHGRGHLLRGRTHVARQDRPRVRLRPRRRAARSLHPGLPGPLRRRPLVPRGDQARGGSLRCDRRGGRPQGARHPCRCRVEPRAARLPDGVHAIG